MENFITRGEKQEADLLLSALRLLPDNVKSKWTGYLEGYADAQRDMKKEKETA